MKKNEEIKDLKNTTSPKLGRRTFLSASLLTGSLCLLDVEVNAQQSPDEVQELLNIVSLADSVGLYTNLLDDVRRYLLQKDYIFIANKKELAAGRWEEIIESAENLQSLSPRPSVATADQTKMLFKLVDNVSASKRVLNDFKEMIKNEFGDLYFLDSRIDSVKSKMLEVSKLIKQNLTLEIESQINNLTQAKQIIDAAIKSLSDLNKGTNKVDKSEIRSLYGRDLVTPDELIALLQAVKSAAIPTSNVSDNSLIGTERNRFLNVEYTATNNSNTLLVASIWSILSKYLDPGSWLQISTAYGLVLPTMAAPKGEKRKGLLRSALTLAYGLRNRESAANELSVI